MKKQPNSHYCFICGVENVAGVNVSFYEDTNAGGPREVLARFTGQSIHQGYPGRMHGGVITGILDETIGRAINADPAHAGSTIWGVTIELSVQFLKPVPLDVELTARGRIIEDGRRMFAGTGEIYLPDGAIAASAAGKYVKLLLDEISDIDPATLGWRVYAD